MSQNKKVLIAMSGGVDSSVAALLLKEEGYDVVGVTMCFSIPQSERKRPSCCGIEGIEDARKVAHQLDIPHYVFQFGEKLQKLVIKDFVSEYLNGRTPNPCVRCNQNLKFGALLQRAKALKIPTLATGHFAQVEKKGKNFLLKKGIDPKKDQSYFLCQLQKSRLAHLVFPVGDMTKDEVRDLAKQKGLYVADKPASQEVCFIPDNDYRSFLVRHTKKDLFKKGAIVDKEGKVLGHHEGIFNYTIGQREGLRIAAAHPLYVIRLDKATNQVVVGKKEDVYSKSLIAIEPNILERSFFKKKTLLKAKIRYNHPESPARVEFLPGNKIKVCFSSPQFAVTPGQFVVFYKGDIVVAGAKIIESI